MLWSIKKVSKHLSTGKKIIMGMGEVWEILEIEPTSDKKIIKQAYAKAVKKYHPEENPEEFQKIHAAYKQALAFAGGSGTGQMQGFINQLLQEAAIRKSYQENGGENLSAPQTDSGEGARIQEIFQQMKSENDKKLFIFRHKWQWYLRNQNNGRAVREMRAYMQTRWFLDIMEEPEVLSQLARGIDVYCREGSRELKEDIRQIYHVDGSDSRDKKPYFDVLLHVLKADEIRALEREAWKKEQRRQWERRQKIERERREAREKAEKKNRREVRIISGVLILLFLCMFIISLFPEGMLNIKFDSDKKDADTLSTEEMGRVMEREKEDIMSFLKENYPLAEFEQPILVREIDNLEYDDGRLYSVKESDSAINAAVDIVYKDGKTYIGEDFGTQYIRKLAEKQGLDCEMGYSDILWDDGKGRRLVSGYYREDEELLAFMEKFKAFLESREVSGAIKNVEGIFFCLSSCHNPNAFVKGAGGIPEHVFYDMEKLPPAQEMAQDMEQAIREYYVHMEPWQVEGEPDYEKWLEEYEEKVEKLSSKPVTEDGIEVEKLAEQLGVKVLIYQDGTYERITAGDMYRMLQKAGIPVAASEGGGGFEVESKGNTNGYENWKDGVECARVMEEFAED